jgi:uncharacterized protein (TIGR02588 family)
VTAPEKNWLEWVVFWAGLALLGGLAGYLVYASAVAGETPPRLAVAIGAPERLATGYAVPVSVTNEGDTTAQSVTIEVESGTGERGEVTLAFVPHGSSRRGWVTFDRQPDPARLRARVVGYEEP